MQANNYRRRFIARWRSRNHLLEVELGSTPVTTFSVVLHEVSKKPNTELSERRTWILSRFLNVSECDHARFSKAAYCQSSDGTTEGVDGFVWPSWQAFA